MEHDPPEQPHVTHAHAPSSWGANVTPEDAEKVLHQLIVAKLQAQGYHSSTASALDQLTHLTERFIGSLFASASHAAEASNRNAPSARDLLYAIETHGVMLDGAPPVHGGRLAAPLAREEERPDPLAGRLSSDSETEDEDQEWKRVSAEVVPSHLPGRPPKHCWIRTPAYPPNAYSGASSSPLKLVDRKLANARLVESSLRRLIRTTDSSTHSTSTVPAPVNYKNVWSARKRKWKF